MALVLTACSDDTKGGPGADVPGVWFDDLAGVQPVAEPVAAGLTAYVTALLQEHPDATPPATWDTDRAPRVVFVSVSDGLSAARVGFGSGEGLRAATEAALADLENSPAAAWVKVDVVGEVEVLDGLDPADPLDAEQDRSLYGLAFTQSSGLAFLPEELVSRTLVDSEQMIRFGNIEKYLTALRPRSGSLDGLQDDGQVAYRFASSSHFSDGGVPLSLYRGHRSFTAPVAADTVMQAAVAAGKYLVPAIGDDGQYVYSYLPKTDDEAEDYNILRHAGTTYSMLELYEVTRDADLLASATRALDYLIAQVQPCSVAGRAARCVVEDDEVKLGGNGLAAVAIAKFAQVTGDRGHDEVMTGLVRWITLTQAADGEFTQHKVTMSTGVVDDLKSGYYPGEALLALMRVYELDGSRQWLDAAEVGANWLIEVRDKGVPTDELNHDHWLLYALDELYQERPSELLLQHARRIVTAMVESQLLDPPFADWYGGWYVPPRSTPVATRAEGLHAAYHMLSEVGTAEELAAIRTSVERAIAFELQTQFMPESAMYLDDPQRVLGGFHGDLTTFEVRIDYVQHNLSALLAHLRLLAE